MHWISSRRLLRGVASSILLACGCLGLVGCGSAAPSGPEVVVAKGKVLIEGEPLHGARLFFVPEGGEAMGAVAASDSGGAFEIVTNGQPGAVPGRYRVTVQYYTKPDGSPFDLGSADADAGMDLDQFVAMGQAKLGIPKRYADPQSTDLVVEVPAAGAETIELMLAKK